MELVFRSDSERRLWRAIQRLCLTHGVVMGLFRLAVADLGGDYANVYRRLRRMEARGQVRASHPGPGRPIEIWIPDEFLR